jgi:hypothetical protein
MRVSLNLYSPKEKKTMTQKNADLKFDPNQINFEQGLERIERGLHKAKVKLADRVITSRDEDARKVTRLLQVDNVPAGFQKWQLPISLKEPSQMFISTAAAYAKVPEHFHRDGDGVRFIISGSIIYKGVELTAGDWMFIPKGKSYSFEVGPLGASMCYCYCCSCACFNLFGEDVINPGPLMPA